jgi:hypothetical protein
VGRGGWSPLPALFVRYGLSCCRVRLLANKSWELPILTSPCDQFLACTSSNTHCQLGGMFSVDSDIDKP